MTPGYNEICENCGQNTKMGCWLCYKCMNKLSHKKMVALLQILINRKHPKNKIIGV
jgi:hypothetical protein